MRSEVMTTKWVSREACWHTKPRTPYMQCPKMHTQDEKRCSAACAHLVFDIDRKPRHDAVLDSPMPVLQRQRIEVTSRRRSREGRWLTLPSGTRHGCEIPRLKRLPARVTTAGQLHPTEQISPVPHSSELTYPTREKLPQAVFFTSLRPPPGRTPLLPRSLIDVDSRRISWTIKMTRHTEWARLPVSVTDWF